MDYQEIIARKEKEKRTRELNYFHKFSLLLHEEKTCFDKLLEETVNLLLSSLQYPDDASCSFNPCLFSPQYFFDYRPKVFVTSF